jgi:hypothetical protein
VPAVYPVLQSPPGRARRWWQHSFLVIVLLACLPPAGIPLTWTSRWGPTKKIIASVLSLLWFILIITPESKKTQSDAKPPGHSSATADAVHSPASPAGIRMPDFRGENLSQAVATALERGFTAVSHDGSDGDATQMIRSNWRVCFQKIRSPSLIDFGVVRVEAPCPVRDGAPIPWPRVPNVIGQPFRPARLALAKVQIIELRAVSAYIDVVLPADHDPWLVCFQGPQAGEQLHGQWPGWLSLVPPGTPCPAHPGVRLDSDQAETGGRGGGWDHGWHGSPRLGG